MLDLQLEQINHKEKQRGLIITIGLHLLLFLIFITPMIQAYVESTEDKAEILVMLSTEIDFTQTETPESPKSEQVKSATAASKAVEKPKDTPKPQPSKTQPLESKPKPTEAAAPVKSETTVEEPTEVEASKTPAPKEKTAEEIIAEKKSKFSDLFGQGSESSESVTDSGAELGDNASNSLDNLDNSGGQGKSSLGQRGIVYKPTIEDDSNKEGKVNVHVCVDSSGKVVSAEFRQSGSTTSDPNLVNKAVQGAKKYKFSPISESDTQCGVISVDFVVRN